MKPETQIVGVAVMSRATKMLLCVIFVGLAAGGFGLAGIGALALIGSNGNHEVMIQGGLCVAGGIFLFWLGFIGVRGFRHAFETPIANEMDSAAKTIVKTREAAQSFRAAASEAAKKAGLHKS